MKERKIRTLQDCIDHANERNGQCLAEIFVNMPTKMPWKCHLGHQWEATFGSLIYMKSWCRTCSGQNRDEQYLRLQNLLKEKGFTLISGIYQGVKKKNLLIQCEKGHQWTTSHERIKHYNCPECSRRCHDKEKNIAAIKAIIERKGGKWISGNYENANSRILIECENGHQWAPKAASIRNADSWCGDCVGLNKDKQLEIMKKIARSHGGECCSTSYHNTDANLKFVCNNNHDFVMSPSNVKKGQWCQKCSFYHMENKTRYTLEKLTGVSFERNGKRIPGFILDGYHKLSDPIIEIAFEYQGEQHYKHIEYFHKTEEKFAKGQENDKIKREECVRLGIHLLEVPYYLANTDDQLLFIVQQFLTGIGLEPHPVESIKDFFNDYYLKSPQIKRIEKIIEEKGGKLINAQYNGYLTPVEIECKNGHKWKTKYVNITQGKWCSTCARRSRDKDWLYKQLKELVEAQGLELITPHYTPDRIEVELKCNLGHVFKRTVNNLKGGSFSCSKCTGRLPREEKEKELRSFIENKGGKLLSRYMTNKINVEIKCENGHIFSIRPNNITSGKKQWCKYCKQI